MDRIDWNVIYTWLTREGVQIAITLLVALIAIWLARKLAVWLAGVLVTKEEVDPAAKKRAQGLATFLKYFFSFLIMGVATAVVLSHLALIELDALYVWLFDVGYQILLTLVLMFAGIWLTQKLAVRLAAVLMWKHGEDVEMKKRANTLANFVKYFLIFIVVVTGGMMILGIFGLEIRPILASAGVVGLAVGFGAQNLVQDVISGFFILLEDQIRVGDVVNIKGKGGFVEKVGLRLIVLRDFDGSVHFIRNGQIDIVSNLTKDFSCYVFDLRIPYGSDVTKINAIFKQVDEEIRADATLGPALLKPLELFGVDRLDESWLIVRARASTKPLQQWNVGRAINGKLAEQFQKHGITFAHQTRNLIISSFPGELHREGSAPAVSTPSPEQGEKPA